VDPQPADEWRLRPRQWSRRQILIAGLALSLPIEGGLIEREWLEVTHHEVGLARLPREHGGLRIAQLSDLHRSAIVPEGQIRAAVDRCNLAEPDLVVLTGDYVTRSAHWIASCARELSRLRSRLGTYAVLGNHDYWTDARLIGRTLQEHGVHMLTNRSAEVAPGLWLGGLDDSWAGFPNLRGAIGSIPGDACPVLLTHNPTICPVAMRRPMLILCGHTHGGQIYIPPFTRWLLPGMRNSRFVRGWYREGSGQVYVNRGIGLTGPPMRLFSRPEISLFTLRAADGPAAWDAGLQQVALLGSRIA
jgi:predicted MPP superfamily phosphohydrolase